MDLGRVRKHKLTLPAALAANVNSRRWVSAYSIFSLISVMSEPHFWRSCFT